MVNVFTPEQRENYNLEGLWRDGESLDISDCLGQSEVRQKPQIENVESLDNWVD